MITYEKINNNLTNILNSDFQTIGFIERNEWLKEYIIEVDYYRYKVNYKDRKRIPFLIHSCIKSRELVKDYLERHRTAQIEFINKCKVKRVCTVRS